MTEDTIVHEGVEVWQMFQRATRDGGAHTDVIICPTSARAKSTEKSWISFIEAGLEKLLLWLFDPDPLCIIIKPKLAEPEVAEPAPIPKSTLYLHETPAVETKTFDSLTALRDAVSASPIEHHPRWVIRKAGKWMLVDGRSAAPTTGA
ncbi:MAG: hypothetical protein QM831_24195 [Kofleriaceae bacterium]